VALTGDAAEGLPFIASERAVLSYDVRVPSPARMYDYYLGGKDNSLADREAADKALSVVPSGRALARANRDFLVRAVRCLAAQGIDQFIDVGTGIPTSPNVHEVAWSVNPGARVVYVDNDPLVIAHDRALLVDSADIAVVHGDIRQPREIMCDESVRGLIDFTRPVGVLLVAVLHFVTDEEYVHESVAVFRSSVPSGSYLVVSHITSDGSDPAAMRTIRDAYSDATAPAVFRAVDDIGKFFDGFELLQPGLADVAELRSGRKPEPAEIRFVGAVGRKP
jgi:hypothetical protein